MQGNLSIQRAIISTQHQPTQHANLVKSNTIAGLLLLLPVMILWAIVSYQSHRARVLRQQVHFLNRIWQLDSIKKLS